MKRYVVLKRCKIGNHDGCYREEEELGHTWICICECHYRRRHPSIPSSERR